MKRSLAAATVACFGGVLLMGSSPVPTPPQAPRKDHVQVFHGRSFVDPYHWLREKGTPEVEKYLEAENAYLEATSGELKPFSGALYEEMLGRIQQTDLSVPVRIGHFYYYGRTVEGLQYPIRCRKAAAADGAYREDAPEEVLLDQNELAKGLAFLSIGDFEVSDDEAQLVYSTDTTGFRQYQLFVKDLKTGSVRGPLAERVTSVAWTADNRTVFYATEHPVTKRSDTLWRLALGAQAVKVHEEPDELFSIGVYRTKDKQFLVLASRSTDTWDRRLLSTATPEAAFRLVLPREKGHKYDVEHRDGTLYIRTNKDAKNFRLVTAPLDDPRPARWKTLVEQRADVLLQDVEVFKDFAGGPGDAGRPQPPSRPRLRLGRVAGGRLPGARLRGVRGGHAGVRLEALPLRLPEPADAPERLRLRHAGGAVAAAEARAGAGRLRPAALRLRAALGHGARRREGADQHRLPEGPRPRRPSAAVALRLRLLRIRDARLLRQPAPEPARARGLFRDRPHPRRRRDGRGVARRRDADEEEEHLLRLRRLRRVPGRARSGPRPIAC